MNPFPAWSLKLAAAKGNDIFVVPENEPETADGNKTPET